MVKKCLICGYIIRETNLDINRDGILKKNSRDNILSCPFCGVGQLFIVDDTSEELNLSHDMDDFTLKVIENAMKLEVFNGDFYKEAATMAMTEDVKSKFIALSNIEYTHAQIHRKIGGFKELAKLKKLDYSRLSDDNMLLQEAKKREEHAIRYYNKYYNEVGSDDIKQVFDALIAVEKEHIIIVDK